MTKAAAHFGKDVRDFMYAESTQAYIEELAKCGKYPQLKDAQKGRYGGTWAHPKLAVFFARWLDVRFAVWCDSMIEDILKGNAEVVVTKPQESAVVAMNTLATLPESPEEITMTSREIAELTGKMHKDVMRDIRVMLDQLGIGERNFASSYKDSTGRSLPEFRFPYRETMILVTGYSVTLRAKVIDRWAELEAGNPLNWHALLGKPIVCSPAPRFN